MDAILIELARAYVTKGNTEEAQEDVHRRSSTSIPTRRTLPEARTELENLRRLEAG